MVSNVSPHALSDLRAALATVTVHATSRRGALTDTGGLNQQMTKNVAPHAVGDLGAALATVAVHAMAGAEPADAAPGTLRLLFEVYVTSGRNLRAALATVSVHAG